MLTEQQFNAKWSEIKSGLRNLWGQLTEQEIESVKRNIYEVSDIVTRKYSESRAEIKNKIDSLMNSFDNETDKRITPDVDSYQRSPISSRKSAYDYNKEIYGEKFEDIPNLTAEKSEFQNEDDGIRDEEHVSYADKTFDMAKEELDDPAHHSNYAQINPNREILRQPLSPDKEKRDFDSDRNARH